MKIIVLGTRGIPGIQGGVETHCEQLYPRLLEDGVNEIILVCRTRYTKDKSLIKYKGISLKNIYAPKNKFLEAIVHSFLSVLYAVTKKPDIVHIHAVGPNLVTLLARIIGLKVVMTHHGPDYKRQKWNWFAKIFLKAGEWTGVMFANRVIVISQEIKEQISKKYHRENTILIPNGVSMPEEISPIDHLDDLGLSTNKYFFSLGRFVPEKGFDYMIDAYVRSEKSKEYKLVIAGDADHQTQYSENLKQLAKRNGIVLTGFTKGDKLHQLFYNSALFILPSFYEGLPISLLEAMSYGLPILATNIQANLEVGLPNDCYYEVGSEEQLMLKLNNINIVVKQRIKYNLDEYDWKKVANKTLKVYESII